MQIELKFIKSSQQRLILIFEEYEFFLSYIYIESNRKMSEKVEMEQSKEQATMARGLAWLTAGNILSRLLGVAYVIPWYIWLGEYRAEANALFSMGYQIYANFLLISSILCKVALETVTPPTKTGFKRATGVKAPVLPT